MTTYKTTLYLFFIMLVACRQNANKTNNQIINKAKQLNDSAVAIVSLDFDSLAIIQAISLLDKAIAIDTNYYLAYCNKFNFQKDLKNYNGALQTSKNMIRTRPNSPEPFISAGLLYEKLGDTLSSKRFFQDGLIRYDRILDTMDHKSKLYVSYLINKAVNLILVGQQKKGNEMLVELYDKDKDSPYRFTIELFIHKSRQEILDNLNQTD